MKKKTKLFKEMNRSTFMRQQEYFCQILFKTLEDHFNLNGDFVTNKTRKREYVYARQIAMTLLSKHTRFSLTDIGNMFNGKDHATVIHAKKTLRNLIDTNRSIKEEVSLVESLVLSKMNLITRKKNENPNFYYINLDNYTSVKLNDEKAIILTGFSYHEINELLKHLNFENSKQVEHIKTGEYILEKTKSDDDTRDSTSFNS